MNNQDKQLLAREVKTCLRRGYSKTKSIDRVSKLGFKRRTVSVYYEVFKG